jgi:S-formylglutathione hydrolase FrmB
LRSNIERYAAERGVALVLPDAQDSFYCDMKYGGKYLTYLIEELPEMAGRMFHISYTRERSFVGGAGAGGYGALKCALLSPERFSGCIALSPITELQAYVDYTAREGKSNLWKGIFGEDLYIEKSHDLYTLASNANSFIHICPKFYIACGKQDSVYEQNLRFKEHLNDCHIDFTFEQANAGEEWSFWDAAVQRGLDLMLS